MKAQDTLRCSGGACLSAGYRWELGEWSKCGSDCTKTRSVSCVDASSGAKTEESKCPGFESTTSSCTDCSSDASCMWCSSARSCMPRALSETCEECSVLDVSREV
eukprot:m51a1_g12502 hypothetical protein (105) ;mRNA; f:47-10273